MYNPVRGRKPEISRVFRIQQQCLDMYNPVRGRKRSSPRIYDSLSCLDMYNPVRGRKPVQGLSG